VPAAVGQPPQVFRRRLVDVHQRHVRPEQPGPVQLGDAPGAGLRAPARHVRGDGDAELPCQRVVAGGGLDAGQVPGLRPHRQGDEGAVVGEQFVPDPADVGGCGAGLSVQPRCRDHPWANTARMPASRSAATEASACAGEFWMCAQSTSVVMPASSAPSAPSRVPAYTSAGW
jgi:hypothetical protein